MVDCVGVDGLDDRKVVHHFRGERHQIGVRPRAAFSALLEFEFCWRYGQARLLARHRGDALAHADGVGQVLVEVLLELRLVVPRIELGRTAIHVEVDDGFCLRRKMRHAGQRRVHAPGCDGRCGRSHVFAEHGGEGDSAETEAGVAEELAAGLLELCGEERVHGVSCG